MSDEPGRPCIGRDRADIRGGGERAVDRENVGVPVEKYGFLMLTAGSEVLMKNHHC